MRAVVDVSMLCDGDVEGAWLVPPISSAVQQVVEGGSERARRRERESLYDGGEGGEQ